MTDIITQNHEDVEDGEIPEDGEICDEEEEKPKRPPVSSSSQQQQHKSQNEKPRERIRRFEQNSPPPRDTDPFGSHNEAPDPPGNEYFGDKDYRSGPSAAAASSEEEPFSDTDYRVNNRRRRLSPAHDDGEYETRSKRPFFNGRGGFRGGFRGGPKPRFQTDHQMCKFFREGYCRDGDNCSYSHQAEDSLRRPVLCNFYANTFCKKGLQCLMLHGEFPCKNFHKGQCQDEQCRFSHVPLTDYTRPIIEKILADEAARQPHQPPVYRQNPVANAAAAAAAAAVMPKRRVLLPGGPGPNGTSPPHSTQVIHAPVPQASHPNQLPPPAVVVPTIQRNSTQMHQYPSQSTGGYFNSGPSTRPEQVQGLPPPRTIEPPRPSNMQQQPMMRSMHPMGGQLQQPGLVHQPHIVAPEKKPEQPSPAFDLEAMLNKLANGANMRNQSPKTSLMDDSPASPPPSFTSSIFGIKPKVAVIPQTQQVVWGIIPCQRRLPYSNVDNADRIPANDPRRAKAIAMQFDAFSSMIGAGGSSQVSDPRLRAQKEKQTTPTTQRVQDPALAAFSSWMPQIS